MNDLIESAGRKGPAPGQTETRTVDVPFFDFQPLKISPPRSDPLQQPSDPLIRRPLPLWSRKHCEGVSPPKEFRSQVAAEEPRRTRQEEASGFVFSLVVETIR